MSITATPQRNDKLEIAKIPLSVSIVQFTDNERGANYDFGFGFFDSECYGVVQVAPQGLGAYIGPHFSYSKVSGKYNVGFIPLMGLQYNNKYEMDLGFRFYVTPYNRLKEANYGMVIGLTQKTVSLGFIITSNKL